jgi:alkylhydroperoxidase family enzyme
VLKNIALFMILRAEKRLGVALDYVRQIAKTDVGLLTRYNRLFGTIDPRKHLPADAYHAARIRAALASDCGSCVQAEINLAKKSKLDPALIDALLSGSPLKQPLASVVQLTDAVVANRQDASEARAEIIKAWGDTGLIELSFAMNGAAMLPGIKRAMGYATACDLTKLQNPGRK